MLGKALSASLIILGVYLVASFFIDLSHRQATLPSYSYHLGCYESNHSLRQSQYISDYLSNLSASLVSSSVPQVQEELKYVNSGVVNSNAANAIALQFKKYIIAHENTKNMNEYQKFYNKGIREAGDDYLNCRQRFLQNGWNCTSTYQYYLATDEAFNYTKGQFEQLIANKYEEQRNIEKLLEPFSTREEPDNETYHKLMRELNERMTHILDSIKSDNSTLGALVANETILSTNIVNFKEQLESCQINKKEVEFCKAIGEKLSEIFLSIDPSDIQARISTKQAIIEKYQNAMAKSLKVGIDTTEIREKVEKNKGQLADLMEMYAEVAEASQCANNLIKCSDQNINQLELNITRMQTQLAATVMMINATRKSISSSQIAIAQIKQLKRKATEQYQNSLGSLDKIKQRQAQNIQKLKIFRDNIHNYNRQISDMEGHIDEAEKKRRLAINELDKVLGRVGELTECLAKKNYLIKLQEGKRPERSTKDKMLKRQAGQKLIRMIRSSIV